jgi:hypothetical protein
MAVTESGVPHARRRVWGGVMAGLVLSAFSLLVPGCGGGNPVINSVGPYSDVSILADRTLMPVAETLRRGLSQEVEYGLKPEKILNVEIYDMKDKKQAVVAKNVIVLGLMDGKDAASRELRHHLSGESMKGLSPKELYVATREDIYYGNQNVVFLAGQDKSLMQSAILKNAAALRGQIEIENRKRVLAFLVGQGRKLDAEAQIRDECGFRLTVPESYKITRIRKGEDRGVAEIAATGPTRTVAIMWQRVDDPAILTDEDQLLDLRRQWGRQFLDEDLQDSGGFTFSRELFLGVEVPMLAGFWEGETYGGPFRTIFYYDAPSARLYGINMLTYAPGMDKHPFMREAHAVAETFQPRP